jgi:23S rRNA (uracil1939-C5)-methyltransferase
MIDVIVVDPPRKGLDHTALDVIRNANCERLIYVSCNPATLVRDLDLLSDRYQIVAIQPVDMFPRSMHVETVVLLSQLIPDDYVEMTIGPEIIEPTDSEQQSMGTYQNIKEYVKRKYNFEVSSLYIAQIKEKYKLRERDNYNLGSGKSKVPKCPREKELAIVDAFSFFRML